MALHSSIPSELDQEKKLSRLIDQAVSIENIEDFICLVGAQSSSIKKRIGELVLCYQSSYFGPRQYCLKKKHLYSRASKNFWPSVSSRKAAFKSGSLYLANELGRPFNKVLALPLDSNYDQEKHSPVLFIEYFSKDHVIDTIYSDDKWEIFRSVFSKVLLEEHWKTGSDLWKCTFDFLNEPLVVVDQNKKPIRFNIHFKKIYQDNLDILEKTFFQDQGNIYEKQSYPVTSDGKSYFIKHFVNITSQFLLRDQIAQNQRMILLGKLADDVAHHLNNPLTGIRSMSQIFLQLKGDSQDLFKEIDKTTYRCQNIIKNFIRFSKQSGFDVTCDLNNITKQTLPFLKTMIQTRKITMDLDSTPAIVKAEPCLLQQVIFNLIKNALQAVGDQGKIKISSQVFEKNIFLSVQDNGCGIQASHQKKLFDPFFTTKEEGTGLGLRISQQLIQKFGGQLTFKSQEGLGSVFTIHLPRYFKSKAGSV